MIGHRLLLVVVVVTITGASGCTGGGGGGSQSAPSATAGIGATARVSATPGVSATPSGFASPGSPAPPTPSGANPRQTTRPSIAPASAPSTVAPPAAWQELAVGAGPSPREDHTWTLSGDGVRAYLFGGRAEDGPSDELWIYNLQAMTWGVVGPANAGPEARFGHTATWVPDVGLVVWSGQGRSGFFDDIWNFEPTTGTWTRLDSAGDVPEARYGSCASLGPDGQLWISHGFTADSGRFADTRSYDFSTGTWTDRTPSGDVPVKRCLHDCFWSSDGELILYGGQTTGVAAIGDLWSFDPASGSWAQAPDPEAAPRQLYALTWNGEAAVVFGGGSADRGYLNDTLSVDPAAPELITLDVDTPPSARSGASLISDPASGDVFLFGGQGTHGLFGDTWTLSGAL